MEEKNIEWSLIKNIVFSWIITLPFTGVISALLFSFAHYSLLKAFYFKIFIIILN